MLYLISFMSLNKLSFFETNLENWDIPLLSIVYNYLLISSYSNLNGSTKSTKELLI